MPFIMRSVICTEIEGLLVEKYADERTAVKVMGGLRKFTQMKDKSPIELGMRATKLSTLAFHEEIRENVTVQAQLTDQQNEHIRHDVIKEALVRFSVAIALVKNSKRI